MSPYDLSKLELHLGFKYIIMKVRASLKKRSADCKIVRRKGRLYIINKKSDLNKDKGKLWQEYQE